MFTQKRTWISARGTRGQNPCSLNKENSSDICEKWTDSLLILSNNKQTIVIVLNRLILKRILLRWTNSLLYESDVKGGQIPCSSINRSNYIFHVAIGGQIPCYAYFMRIRH